MSSVQVAPDRPALPPTPISFEEFLAWADEDTHAEWVNGEIVLMSPSNVTHHRIILFLSQLLDRYVRAHRLGEVFLAGVLMRLATRPSVREPDLLFVAASHADRVRETYLDGPADLVVEVVSPESVERDRVDKLAEYEVAGIPEYWLIDPLVQEARFHRRGEDGRYRIEPVDADGFYRSAVLPGFRLRVDWLWQRPLPPVEDVVAQTEAGAKAGEHQPFTRMTSGPRTAARRRHCTAALASMRALDGRPPDPL